MCWCEEKETTLTNARYLLVLARQRCIDIPQTSHLFSPPPEPLPEPLNIQTKNQMTFKIKMWKSVIDMRLNV